MRREDRSQRRGVLLVLKAGVGKKLALAAGGLLISVLLLELGASLAYRIWHGRTVSRSEIQRRLAAPLEFEADGQAEGVLQVPLFVSNKKLHPYLGFVYGPGLRGVNSHGFFGPEPAMEASEETLDVAIFGGSLALSFAGEGQLPLQDELKSTGKKLRIVCFAVDGYKQPQQLAALAYMLALGAKFDVAINLDGFNEIALPITENAPNGVFPFYPRAWDLYSASGFQPEVAARTARIADYRSSRIFWRRLFSRWPLTESLFLLVFWDSLDRYNEGRSKKLDAEIRGLLAPGNARGPQLPWFDPARGELGILQASARVWRDASLQMAALCRANNVPYLHFLQPNQYVADSKVFSEEERRSVFGEAGYRSAVEQGYPLLLRESEKLLREGVGFHDLTGVFSNHGETVYKDSCCHVNARGNEILAREIGLRVRQTLANPRD